MAVLDVCCLLLLYRVCWDDIKVTDMLEKKVLKTLTALQPPIIILSSYINVFFFVNLTLSDIKGLIVFQNVLLSLISFSLRFPKQSDLDFLRSETQYLRCFDYFLFSSFLSFKNLFLVIISLSRALFTKDIHVFLSISNSIFGLTLGLRSKFAFSTLKVAQRFPKFEF